MKTGRFLLFFFILILLSLSVKAAAAACACCAEPGQYSISVKKPDASDLEILRDLRFATANLFTTAAYPDNIKGINPLADSYSINGLFQNNAWKLNIRDDRGKTGLLALPLPSTMVAFAADIHDRSEGETILYKEWRFKYKVRQGTGIFQKGVAPLAEYFLVLQGRGNNCANSADFKNWRVEITGKNADYAFYGNLKTE